MKKATLEVRGLIAMLDFIAVEKRFEALPGVVDVVMNPGGNTATVTYDEARTDAGTLVDACRFHCRGETVPRNICLPDSTVVASEHLRDSARRKLAYSAGLMVLAEDRPHEVIYRSPRPLLTPETSQERQGAVANVVFPTGIDRCDDLDMPNRFDVYHGMADSRIGVARFDLPGFFPPIDGRPASVGAWTPAANNSCSEKNA